LVTGIKLNETFYFISLFHFIHFITLFCFILVLFFIFVKFYLKTSRLKENKKCWLGKCN